MRSSLRAIWIFSGILFVSGITGCSIRSTGVVKDDTTLTGTTQRLAEAGLNYTGPEYTVGIITFENKTPSKVLGVGEAATTILRTLVESSGLRAVLLDEGELKDQQKFRELQQSGVVRKSKRDTGEGMDPVDYRVSGAITGYSEVEEGIDAIVFQKKERVARVTVDYALVDISTGKSLVTESGAGEYRKATTGALGLGAKSSFDPNLRDGALRDALAKAMTKMIAKLSDQPFQGKVLLTRPDGVVIRAGTRSHLGEGTRLTVYRPGEVLRDPDSGEVLGRSETKVGVVEIRQHQNERVSMATVVSGQDFRPGDIVKVNP